MRKIIAALAIAGGLAVPAATVAVTVGSAAPAAVAASPNFLYRG